MNEKKLGPFSHYIIIKLFLKECLDPDTKGFCISKQDKFYLSDYCKFKEIGKFEDILAENLPEIYAAEKKLKDGQFLEINHEVIRKMK